MILSLLIPTMPSRRTLFERLLLDLRTQVLKCGKEVEILADAGDGTVGAKRQRLIEKAQGDYVAFIDDDDGVDPLYLQHILEALKLNPDVVGFNGVMTTNGTRPKKFNIKKGNQYDERGGVYYRYNNHLCPVKRSIALQVGYKDMGHGEDFEYATRLKEFIKTEVFIDQSLYYYRYLTKK